MAQQDNNTASKSRISQDERFKFIGFEVFPGKPKDLFQSDDEKSKLVQTVVNRRRSKELGRENCTLLEARVTGGDRTVVIVACVLAFLSLFLPWYSVYNEVEEKAAAAAPAAGARQIAGQPESPSTPGTPAASGTVTQAGSSPSEELITSYKARKKFHREYARLSGLGALAAIGSVGGKVFSSGFALILTGLTFIIYTLACIAVPVYSLYGLFGIKGGADERALMLKQIARYNWLPVILFVGALVLSFFGADYGFDATKYYSSVGKSYGPGVFLESLSWGVPMSLASFIVVAVKGVEI